MITIKMTKKHESGLLLGELTNGMWISQNGQPIYKETLANSDAAALSDYQGEEKVELEDALFNQLTAEYFLRAKKPSNLGVSS